MLVVDYVLIIVAKISFLKRVGLTLKRKEEESYLDITHNDLLRTNGESISKVMISGVCVCVCDVS